jgi:hypothetical protein
MLRRAAFVLGLLFLAAYAYSPLWGAGPLGADLVTLLDVGPVAWPGARGDGSFGLADLYGVHGLGERPLATLVLAFASRLLTVDGRWTGAEIVFLRLANLGLLLLAAWGLARFVRRALLPWTGTEGARFAGYASSLLLALHPLAVSVVARPASAGDLLGLAVAAGAAVAFLQGRQERRHALVVVAVLATIACGLLSELAYFLALVVALVELVSARRSRPLPVRLRTAGTTLAVFGGAASVELALRVLAGVPVSVPGLVGVWLSGEGAPTIGATLAVAVEKLGILILPVHPFGGLGPPGFVLAGAGLLVGLEPALVAARSAPRLWGWLLATWGASIALVELSTSAARVPPETLAGAEALFPAVIVMAVGLGISSAALSGLRRVLSPLFAGACYAVLAHAAALPFVPAGGALAELRQDLGRARELHGRDAALFVVDPPELVAGLDVLGGALPRLCDPALTGEPERPLVRGLSSGAFAALCREPEIDALRAGRLVVVYPPELLGDASELAADAEPPPGRRSARLPPPGPKEGPVLWRREPSSPLFQLDPLRFAAARVTAQPGVATAEPPQVFWRAAALNGVRAGAWLAGADGPVALCELDRSFAWLVGREVRRVWVEGDLAGALVSCEMLAEPPAVEGLERRRDGPDWRVVLAAGRLPEPLAGGAEWRLGLLDLATYAWTEIEAVREAPGVLLVPDAATWEDARLRAGGGPIAWSLDLRAGDTTIARASGRIAD